MKKNLLLIVILLGSLNVVKAQKLDIIPKPVHIQQKPEVFVIPSSVQLIIDPGIQKSASYISSGFLKNSGISPKVSIGNKHKKHTILFLVDKKIIDTTINNKFQIIVLI